LAALDERPLDVSNNLRHIRDAMRREFKAAAGTLKACRCRFPPANGNDRFAAAMNHLGPD
jgi:hypothetical protein